MIIAGDVGGTKTILQLIDRRNGRGEGREARAQVAFEQRLQNAEFPDFDSLLARFLSDARGQGLGSPGVEIAVLGAAGPVGADSVRLTNLPWEIDAHALAARFDIAQVRIVNDFEAAAHGIALLEAADLVALQPGEPAAHAPQVVLGAGTGLGVAFRVWQGGGYEVVAGEGGNMAFAPTTEEQGDLWRHLHARSGWVAVEQVVSGPGLASAYAFLRERGDAPESCELAQALLQEDQAAAIARFALQHDDPLANRALDLFVEAYGAAAGDFALAVLAQGGVFVAGGIAARIVSRLRRGDFIRAFNAKGRFAARMQRIPVNVVVNESLGVLGARAIALRWCAMDA